MNIQDQISMIVEQGVSFVASQQDDDGCFSSLSSADPDNFKDSRRYRTTFFTSNILAALSDCSDAEEWPELCAKGTNFLIQQKSRSGSFNYWDRFSEEAKAKPYPDDWDDTACALIALIKCSPDKFDGALLAQTVKLLIATEKKPGGPYRTWIVSKGVPKNWQDIDFAVNCNIAYLLSLKSISLPALDGYLHSQSKSRKFSTPYYPSSYLSLYFLSRTKEGLSHCNVISRLLTGQKKDPVWDNTLNKALSLSALVNISYTGPELQLLAQDIIDAWQSELWQPYAFCIDPSFEGRKHYAASSALTAALCIEALRKYAASERERDLMTRADTEVHDLSEQAVLKKVESAFGGIKGDLKDVISSEISTLLSKDQQKQIPLLPCFFSESLASDHSLVTKDFIAELGAANVWGWLAYALYDGFLDNQGERRSLPAANFALTQSIRIYNKLMPPSIDFDTMLGAIFAEMEEANFWEVSNCRFDPAKQNVFKIRDLPAYNDYFVIGSKSMGHALGPLAILSLIEGRINTRNSKHLTLAFKNYLVARQLNDDAHDWEEDLRSGQLSSVATIIIIAFANTYGRPPDLNKDMVLMQQLFWKEVLIKVSATISHLARAALAESAKVDLLKSHIYMQKMTQPLLDSAQEALEKRSEVLKFIRGYRGDSGDSA